MNDKFQPGETPCELWYISATGSRPVRQGAIRATHDGLALYQGPDDVDEAFGFVLPDGSMERALHFAGAREGVARDYSAIVRMRWDGRRWVEVERLSLSVSVRSPEQG